MVLGRKNDLCKIGSRLTAWDIGLGKASGMEAQPSRADCFLSEETHMQERPLCQVPRYQSAHHIQTTPFQNDIENCAG